jgi:hypothetical protein
VTFGLSDVSVLAATIRARDGQLIAIDSSMPGYHALLDLLCDQRSVPPRR